MPPAVATVAQLISLTTWGNAYLRRKTDAAGLNRNHSTLRLCNKVAFADKRGLLRPREVPMAADPLTWLRVLREEGCHAIRLRFVPPPDPSDPPAESSRESGRNGDSTWFLETQVDDVTQRWSFRWELTNRYAPEQRKWSVVYTRIERKAPAVAEPVRDLGELRDQLAETLASLDELVRRHRDSSILALESIRNVLQSEKPLADHEYSDLLPNVDGTLAARQLLAACCRALAGDIGRNHVHAGGDFMPDREEAQRHFAALYSLIAQCVEHAANSWAGDPPSDPTVTSSARNA